MMLSSTSRRSKRSLPSNHMNRDDNHYNEEEENVTLQANNLSSSDKNGHTQESVLSSSLFYKHSSSCSQSPSFESPQSRHHERLKQSIKVMSQSGQTENDRRELRNNQRSLFHKMTDSSLDIGDKMADVHSDKFEKIRVENNNLWTYVRFTREAVLDGDNFDVITNKAVRQVDKLITVPRYDSDRLTKKLRSKCSMRTHSSFSSSASCSNSTIFDWKTFGFEVGSCFNSVPTYCSFFNGTINSEYTPKTRKKPIRRFHDDDDMQEEIVETIHQKSKTDNHGNKLSAVEKQLSVINRTLKLRDEEQRLKVLHNLSIENYGKSAPELSEVEKKEFKKRIKKCNATRPCAMQFAFNPKSFTQTVENIFGLSFMVKKGDAEVGIRNFDDCKDANLKGIVPGPWVKKVSGNNGDHSQPPARQAIVSITMQDWRALNDAYEIENGDIPHRMIPKSK